MKKGRIVLGAAAFVVTAASALAFRAHNAISGHQLFGETKVGSGNCTLSTCFTNTAGLESGKCHTVVNLSHTAFTGGSKTLWTKVTSTNHVKCVTPIRRWTHNS